MGGQVFDTLGHLAGYGVGALSALTSIKGGGLQNWLLNRQRAVEDPSIRASLVGSPFASGMLFQSGGDVAAPGTMPAAGGVAAPDDVRWLQQQNPTRHFLPALPPLPAEQQVQTQAAQGIVSGLQSSDPVVRAQAKLAGKIPLTPEETGQIVGGGVALQRQLGLGSTVGVSIPGMPIQIGSPYVPGSEEYPTFEIAAAAANARNAGLAPGSPQWRVMPSGRGTFLLAPPPTHEQALPQAPPPPATSGAMPGNVPAPVMRGGTPPAPTVPGPGTTAGPPLFAGAMTTTGGAPPTLPERHNNPGDIKDGSFARSQPGYVGPGETAKDGGRFAVFDSPASGQAAMGNLLSGKNYAGLTLGDAASKWSNGGYGADWVAKQGFDPSRTVASLAPDEMTTFTGAMARREGYRGALASNVPVQPATPTVAPSPPPRQAPAPVTAPSFDPNATVPHVIVPASPAADATVGYPPPAPAPPPGTIAPSTIPVLRSPGAPAAAIPGAPAPAPELPGIPVDPNTGLPLTGRTYESQTGSATYTAPPRGDPRTQMLLRYNGIADPATADPGKIVNYFATDQALKNNESMDKAAIERAQRGMTEGESTEFTRLIEMKTAYNDFIKEYPDADSRAKFLGFVDAPIQTLRAKLGWQDAQAIRDFRNAFGPFALESLTDEKGKPQAGMEWVGGMAPSVRDSAGEFESNLQHFGDALDRRLTIMSNLRAMPVGSAGPGLVDSWVNQLQHQSLANRLGAFQPPPPAVVPSGGPPSAEAAPPPAATPASPWQPNWVQ